MAGILYFESAVSAIKIDGHTYSFQINRKFNCLLVVKIKKLSCTCKNSKEKFTTYFRFRIKMDKTFTSNF